MGKIPFQLGIFGERNCRNQGQFIFAHGSRIKFPRRRRHPGQGSPDRHRRSIVSFLETMKSARIDPGNYIASQIGTLEAPILQFGDDLLDLDFDPEQARGIALALLQARREGPFTESVHLLEKWAVGASRKAADVFFALSAASYL